MRLRIVSIEKRALNVSYFELWLQEIDREISRNHGDDTIHLCEYIALY